MGTHPRLPSGCADAARERNLAAEAGWKRRRIRSMASFRLRGVRDTRFETGNQMTPLFAHRSRGIAQAAWSRHCEVKY